MSPVAEETIKEYRKGTQVTADNRCYLQLSCYLHSVADASKGEGEEWPDPEAEM